MSRDPARHALLARGLGRDHISAPRRVQVSIPKTGVARHRGVEAGILHGQPEGVLPARGEAHPRLRLGVGAIVVILARQRQHHQGGRQARPSLGRVLLQGGIVVVGDQPIAMGGQAGLGGVGRDERRPGARRGGGQIMPVAHHGGAPGYGDIGCLRAG